MTSTTHSDTLLKRSDLKALHLLVPPPLPFFRATFMTKNTSTAPPQHLTLVVLRAATGTRATSTRHPSPLSPEVTASNSSSGDDSGATNIAQPAHISPFTHTLAYRSIFGPSSTPIPCKLDDHPQQFHGSDLEFLGVFAYSSRLESLLQRRAQRDNARSRVLNGALRSACCTNIELSGWTSTRYMAREFWIHHRRNNSIALQPSDDEQLYMRPTYYSELTSMAAHRALEAVACPLRKFQSTDARGPGVKLKSDIQAPSPFSVTNRVGE
ncbi:hypothetical protein D9619_008385 [Psilocybe cf. subviscida]|uniref:Uncharacterized protein n=1 Tax=Psilocybe cf. subviscida TaxID=2480587 RepID=A0A8H5F0G5_9AGAR|nr:hypothetical protein D9619_008385 [Psilocybe cf. subviscida]